MHFPMISPPSTWRLHEHISYTNSVCKGQAGPSSSPPEETQTYCQGQSVSLQPGWPDNRPKVLCSGAQTTSVATVSLCAVSFTVSSQGAHFWGEKSRALWWDQPCPAPNYRVILQTLHHYCTQWLPHVVAPLMLSLFPGLQAFSLGKIEKVLLNSTCYCSRQTPCLVLGHWSLSSCWRKETNVEKQEEVWDLPFPAVYIALHLELSHSVNAACEGTLRTRIQSLWDGVGCITSLAIHENKQQEI